MLMNGCHAGIVPYINASIVLQLLATAFPSLKKLQREEGPQVGDALQLQTPCESHLHPAAVCKAFHTLRLEAWAL